MRQAPGHNPVGRGPEKFLVMHDGMATPRSCQLVWPMPGGRRFRGVFRDYPGYGLSRDLAGECTSQGGAAHEGFRLADELGRRRHHVTGHLMTKVVAQRLAADARARHKAALAGPPVQRAPLRPRRLCEVLLDPRVTGPQS